MKLLIKMLICAFVLTACGQNLTDAEHLAQARSYFEKGDINTATIEVKNALKKNPDNGASRVLLGQLYLQTGNAKAAEIELLKAEKLGMSQDDYLPSLSLAYKAQGKWEELKGLSTGDLASVGKSDLLASQGLAFLADRDVAQATQLIQQAVEMAPDSITALLAKARLELATNQPEEARSTLNRVIELDGQQVSAWELLGDLEVLEKQLDAAESAYTKSIQFGKQPFLARLKRANIRIQQKQMDLAQQDIDQLLKASPEHPLVHFAQGRIQAFHKKPKEALISFEKTVRFLPTHAPALYALALTHFQLGSAEQAEQYAYKFVAQDENSLLGHKILGAILFKNGKMTEAEQEMRKVLEIAPEDPAAMNLLASILFKQNKKDESVALLQKIAKRYPDSAYAQLRLGAGLVSEGKRDEGEALMEKASALNPEFHQADVALIMLNLQQKDFDQALSLAESYRDKNPEAALPHNLVAMAQLGLTDVEAAKNALSEVLKINPGDMTANNTFAMLALKNKEIETAEKHFQTILSVHENHLPTLMKMAALSALKKDKSGMVGYLDQAISAHANALAPRIIKARYFLAEKEPEKVSGLFQGMDGLVNQSPDALSVIAKSQLVKKKYAESKLTLEKLAALKPDSALVQYQLAQSYAGVKDADKMVTALNKAVELRPDYVDARVSLVSYLMKAKPEEALPHLEQLKKIAPDHALTSKLEAVVQNRLGDPDKALTAYQKVFDATPSTNTLLPLVRQHVYMKQRGEAIQLLESWVGNHPEDIRARLLLANEYIALGGRDQDMFQQYDAILEIQPENLVALNNLAWHLREQDPKRALQMAKKANTLKPDNSTLMDTLAVVQLENQQVDAAKQTIASALKIAPENPSVRYHSALIDSESGDILGASQKLQALLEEEASFRQREEAVKLMEKLRQ